MIRAVWQYGIGGIRLHCPVVLLGSQSAPGVDALPDLQRMKTSPLHQSAAACFLLPLLFLAVTTGWVKAQAERSPFTALGQYRFSTDIDGGGDFSSGRLHFKGAAPIYRSGENLIAISAAYGWASYDFSGGGSSSYASYDPWDDLHLINLGLPVKWSFDGGWDLFLAPGVRWYGENGADFGDAVTVGGIAGFARPFGERLTLGPGVGVFSQLEDDASVFPVVLVDWKITDALSLSTGPTIGATQGPGLMLNWDVTDRLRFSAGARYEKHRFRLDGGSGESRDGVGEDRSIPVFGALSLQAGDHWQLALLGGVAFGSELTIEDRNGRTVSERDTDPSPFVGLSASLRF